MTVQEIISEIPRLTFAERASVVETYAKSLKTDAELLKVRIYRGASVDEVRGAIKFLNGHVPNDEEVDELRFEALSEKYLR
jgi:hypothetical protein